MSESDTRERRRLPPDLLAGLFETPELYVADIEPGGDLAFCYWMDRTTYSRSTFLDQRTVATDKGACTLPLSAVVQQYRKDQPDRRRAGYIAHTALCGSTLLSRCLDLPGICLPYKEPYLLHRLSFARRIRPEMEADFADPSLLELDLALLTRTYEEREKPVIKLTDTGINLCPDLLDHHESSTVLLLYHALPRFLTAILKNDERRAYARNMLDRAKLDLAAMGRLESVETSSLTDARCAAFVWIGLMYPYLALLAAHPERARSLNASDFFQDPRGALAAIADFFALDMTEDMIEHQLSAEVLGRDAKFVDRIFDSAEYEAEVAARAMQLQDEIDDAVEWAASLTSDDTIPSNLPNPLVENLGSVS